jgi:AP-4 complex subunit beta-1
MPVLERGLDDPSSYVRRNAVMAVLKLYHLQSDYVVEGELVDKLYGMLRDPDAQVISSCLMVLNEIMLEEGGIAINKSIIYHLLNQIKCK